MKKLIIIALLFAGSLTINGQATESQRFDRYMVQARKLAPRYGYTIKPTDEDWDEWFWLYYFQDGASPRKALAETRKYDRIHAMRRTAR